jgi:hypothetical protein
MQDISGNPGELIYITIENFHLDNRVANACKLVPKKNIRA